MKSLDKLQAEARHRHQNIQEYVDLELSRQKNIEGSIEREKLADDLKEVLEMGGLLSLVYVKRYKPEKEKPFKTKLFIEEVSEPKLLPTKKKSTKRFRKDKIKIIKEFKEVFEGMLTFKHGFTYYPEKMKEPIYSKRKTFGDETLPTPKQVNKPKRAKPVKPQYDIEKIKQFIESKKEPPVPKVIIRDSRPEDNYEYEKKAPLVRAPAVYSNRNAIDDYVD